MATRNLARTVVEGGRRGRYEEYYCTRSERQSVRVQLRKIFVEGYDEEGFVDERRFSPYGTDFADKLNPALRWLDAQVGRRWDTVYSELRQKFDVRTTKGRHLIEHIVGAIPGGVGWVNVNGVNDYCYTYRDQEGKHLITSCHSRCRYMIDKNGILRAQDKRYTITKIKVV